MRFIRENIWVKTYSLCRSMKWALHVCFKKKAPLNQWHKFEPRKHSWLSKAYFQIIIDRSNTASWVIFWLISLAHRVLKWNRAIRNWIFGEEESLIGLKIPYAVIYLSFTSCSQVTWMYLKSLYIPHCKLRLKSAVVFARWPQNKAYLKTKYIKWTTNLKPNAVPFQLRGRKSLQKAITEVPPKCKSGVTT